MENCYHCGDPCLSDSITHQDKMFCCNGCKTVYDILHENDLEYYYNLDQNPGISPKAVQGKFDFLT
ncbi:heavy metal translocating P-type ATPase metal-binding domain-containing protein, partial [Leeuwenhoekiella sp. UBA1003]